MLEVLIAVVILSIGLLGIAAMQVVSMKNNHSAYLRSQAALLAYEFTDILRSNPLQRDAGKFGDSADNGIDLNTANLGFDIDTSCNGSGCTPDKMAETDLANWAFRINQSLPSGMATVDRAGNVYTVVVSWLDDRSDTDSQGVDVNGNGNTNDTLSYNDDVGAASNVVVSGNEANFKQIRMSFEP